MKITARGLMMASALVASGGWFGFDYFGGLVGFGSTGKQEAAAAVASVPELMKTPGESAEGQPGSVNPLNGISLASLTQTVERPLFNRTRAPKPKPEPQVVEEAPEPEAGPQDFTLLGIVVADDHETAVLKFNKTNEIYHLKAGQSFEDWQVAEIGPKSVTVKKAELSFSLQLFEQPTDTGAAGGDDEDVQQPQLQRPPQLRQPQLRQHRQLPQRAHSRKRPANNDDDSDASDDQPQAVSRLEHG